VRNNPKPKVSDLSGLRIEETIPTSPWSKDLKLVPASSPTQLFYGSGPSPIGPITLVWDQGGALRFLGFDAGKRTLQKQFPTIPACKFFQKYRRRSRKNCGHSIPLAWNIEPSLSPRLGHRGNRISTIGLESSAQYSQSLCGQLRRRGPHNWQPQSVQSRRKRGRGQPAPSSYPLPPRDSIEWLAGQFWLGR
jgi:hypothetical protein